MRHLCLAEGQNVHGVSDSFSKLEGFVLSFHYLFILYFSLLLNALYFCLYMHVCKIVCILYKDIHVNDDNKDNRTHNNICNMRMRVFVCVFPHLYHSPLSFSIILSHKSFNVSFLPRVSLALASPDPSLSD